MDIREVSATLEYKFIASARWGIYKNFLDEYGGNYHQIFLTDTRDVIFQGDVFEKYSAASNFLGYVTEGELIKNSQLNCRWIAELFGKEEKKKLGDEKIICSGTVLGNVDEIKIFCEKMAKILVNTVILGDDQGAMNYLVYEKLLPIKNLIEIDCHSGNILTAFWFHVRNSIKIADEKILRGDEGIPAIVHQYDKRKESVQLVDNLYRDKNFQPNEKFTDTRSMLEQTIYLATVDRIDDAYKLFTKYLFGKIFIGYVDNLINLWGATLNRNILPANELLILSIQSALMSTGKNSLSVKRILKILGLTNFCIKNHIVVSYHFKIFVKNILFSVANSFYSAKQFEQSLTSLNFISDLEIPLDQNYYLFQAKIYREAGKKSEALAAYEKALG